MIRFKMCEDYLQYVDGMTNFEREGIDQTRNVDGCTYCLCSMSCPELYISLYTRHVALYLPGRKTQKDHDKIHFDKDDKDVILKLFEVYKDMLQLEGADRWIL